jgi:hypothetical protein
MSVHYSGIVQAGDGVVIANADSSPTSYQIYRSGSDVYWFDGSSSVQLNQSASGGTAVGDLEGVYSNAGNSVELDEGAITFNDATTGSLNMLEFVKDGAGSGNIIDIAVDAALTGNAIDMDMNLGIAANAIYIDNGATARTGADFKVKDDSTGNHSIIDIDSSGSGASVGFDFTGSYNGSPGGYGVKLTLDASDNLDTVPFYLSTGAGTRGVMFDINCAHTDSGKTSHIFDIDVTTILDSNVIDVAYGAASTGNTIFVNLDNAVAATALHIEGSGERTQPMVEIATDATGSSDLIDIAVTGVISGNVVNLDIGAAVTGNVVDIDMNSGLDSKALYIDAGAGTRTADLIDVKHDGDGNNDVMNITATNTGSGSIFDINMNGVGSTSGVFNIDMNAAVGATVMTLDAGAGTRTVDMIDVTFDGNGDVGFLDLNCTNTGSGDLLDIDVTGVHTGNVLDITYGSAASTGDAINITQGTNVAGSALVIGAAGARTDDLVKIDSSATGSGLVFDISMTGAGSGNVFDVTYSSGANTGNAIDINMGTNVAGMAISVNSAATGVDGEGAALDIAHSGNLIAGADAVRITSTGSISSTSNLLAIEGSGASHSGAYGLYINATGTNLEAIKVDAGNVVLDENLSVGGTLDVTTGVQCASVARTATDDGDGDGVIADGTTFVTVDADGDPNHILTLPTPTPGNIVWITENGSTGFELATDTPASVAINGGSEANAESAIPEEATLVRCVCVSATSWICSYWGADGEEAKVPAAAA